MNKQFIDFLLSRVDHYDQKILEDIRPIRKVIPRWWKIRESVRKLSEMGSFVESEKVEEEVEDGWIGRVAMGTFPQPSGLKCTFKV